ncbi:sulfotransferase domain-containing protein [Rubrivirga sp.]|uniref:sulfotransferase domain-containing protein n=1 Tax=Rubrivirga sp. TaxID=1885344 RepID=UPI003B526476
MQYRRKLTRPAYVLDKLALYGRSRLTMERDDVILAFYPKTGSTWVRFFLYNMLTGSASAATFDEVNAAMPEYGHPSLFTPWPFASSPRLVKTHLPYSPLLFGPHPTALTVRDPRDIMVSLYHYAKAKRTLDLEGSIHDLIWDDEMGLEPFFKHYASWAPRAGLVTRYEDLKAAPVETFGALCDFCGIPSDPERIEAALEASGLQRMRDAQKASPESFKNHDPSFVFARKGTAGQWQEHFDDRALAYYHQLCDTYGFHLYD